MTAKEMFEELGYRQIYNTVNYIIYDFETKFEIKFYRPHKNIEIVGKEPYNTLDMEELQAINKQVEELGWLDETRN